MQRTTAEGRGPVRYGPPAPQPGLPVLPELLSVLTAAAGRTAAEPAGGGPAVREAACRHWGRRGLPTAPQDVAAGPGAPALLLALLAAHGGDVLLPRPCPAWWTPQVRMLGRRAYHVPTPAECGGVPDPYALLETVRRVRAEGGDPRVLLLSAADDPTATVPPPDMLREACEAAESAGLFVVSDESWRDTVHRPRETLVLSPAEMLPDGAAVLVDLAGALLPASWPAAVLRFPDTPRGTWLRARTLDVLTATGALVAGPVAAAAAHALDEPDAVAGRAWAEAALHGAVAAAAHRELLAAGALARPPQAGRHLYADLGPLRAGLARQGVGDAMELEDWLGARLGVPTPGGQRFADELGALRVRLSTGPLLGATPQERLAALHARDPLGLPHVRRALDLLGSTLGGLA
ncbi:aminotransferase class I/II-fold pyridoxal phosphate-dependent enzyme [Streptomyces subrutilus]|nr:aminotransferase class I/II-fold pyridoxal phosphate-dependent enzyme [Streptomyces subrutilus]QEU78043.1 aminotransferase class I/II-fold pyridoxal phosphate-dependent enzyme [Streptomyces subrutilus]WSJ32806.1 aminotransferase class I/II-fold pyridoxal phosphate-dependent enzyme [Streptomyces subrutilus]